MNRGITIMKYGILVLSVIFLSAGLLTPLFGGPGADDDPIVSLSYLEVASRFGEIKLPKGENLPVPSGASFVLLDGDAELGGVGDYLMVDLTIGKSFKRGKGISENHLYIITGGSDIKITAKDNIRILVKGIDSTPSRKAMK